MNVIKADLYKLMKSPLFYILFGITTICGIAITLISHFLQTGDLPAAFIGTAAGLMDNMIINIAAPTIMASYLCGDFQNKTIHDEILYGHGRKSILWSKFVPYTIIMLLLLLPYALGTLIGVVTNAGFSPEFANNIDSSYMTMLADCANHTLNTALIGKTLACLLVTAIVYIARISILFILCIKLRKPIPVILVGVLLEMGLGIAAGVASSSDIIRQILSWTPFLTMRDSINFGTSIIDLLKMVGTSLVFIVIIMNITNGIFHKAEVK